MKCSKCGFENPENGVFCTNCGKSLVEQEKEEKFCPNCGSKIEKNNDFCSECGYNFITKEIPSSKNKKVRNASQTGFEYRLVSNILGLVLGFLLILFPFISIGYVQIYRSFNLITIFGLFQNNFSTLIDGAYISGAIIGLLKVIIGLFLVGSSVTNLINKNKTINSSIFVFLAIFLISVSWGIYGTYCGTDSIILIGSFLFFIFKNLLMFIQKSEKLGNKLVVWVGCVLLGLSLLCFIGSGLDFKYNGLLSYYFFAIENSLNNGFLYVGIISAVIVIVSLVLIFYVFVKPNFKVASIIGIINSVLLIILIIANNVVAQLLGYKGSPIPNGVISLVFCLVGTLMIFVYHLNEKKSAIE